MAARRARWLTIRQATTRTTSTLARAAVPVRSADAKPDAAPLAAVARGGGPRP
jgi:hypothetical protein